MGAGTVKGEGSNSDGVKKLIITGRGKTGTICYNCNFIVPVLYLMIERTKIFLKINQRMQPPGAGENVFNVLL